MAFPGILPVVNKIDLPSADPDRVLEEVEEGNYMNSDEDFFEFMSYKFESSIGDYEDQKYDEYDDERHGL